jgi:hypothetical protein
MPALCLDHFNINLAGTTGVAHRHRAGYLAPLDRYAPRRRAPGAAASAGGHRRSCLVLTVDPRLARKLDTVHDLRPII